jgi:hypothetical protein
MGAEMAGNADGSIPAWKPLPKNAGSVDSKGFLSDPFGSEKPLFTITAQNVEQYKDKLAPGQYAMFKRYPDTFKMPVYPSHRGSTVPDDVFAAIKKNATTTNLVAGGNGLENFDTAVPFPIPKSGLEVIWNHITRYRGGSVTRLVTQATPQANGSFSLVYFQDQFVFRDKMKDYDPANPGNILFYFKQKVTAPARLAGTVLLVHETLDQVKEPRKAWVYNAGQRRVRQAPQVSYDGRVPPPMACALPTTSTCTTVRRIATTGSWKARKRCTSPPTATRSTRRPQVRRHHQGRPHQPGPDPLRAASGLAWSRP